MSKKLAEKFAHYGYAAICPDLHLREGKGTPEANSASVQDAGGMPDNRTMGDVVASKTGLATSAFISSGIQ